MMDGMFSEVMIDNGKLPWVFDLTIHITIHIISMGGTEKTKLFAEEDIAKLAVLKSNDTVAKK